MKSIVFLLDGVAIFQKWPPLEAPHAGDEIRFENKRYLIIRVLWDFDRNSVYVDVIEV